MSDPRSELEEHITRLEAKYVAELIDQATRHRHLADHHAGHPVLAAVLDAHKPRTGPTPGDAVCHGCPATIDEKGTEHHAWWPCTTWQLINTATNDPAPEPHRHLDLRRNR